MFNSRPHQSKSLQTATLKQNTTAKANEVEFAGFDSYAERNHVPVSRQVPPQTPTSAHPYFLAQTTIPPYHFTSPILPAAHGAGQFISLPQTPTPSRQFLRPCYPPTPISCMTPTIFNSSPYVQQTTLHNEHHAQPPDTLQNTTSFSYFGLYCTKCEMPQPLSMIKANIVRHMRMVHGIELSAALQDFDQVKACLAHCRKEVDDGNVDVNRYITPSTVSVWECPCGVVFPSKSNCTRHTKLGRAESCDPTLISQGLRSISTCGRIVPKTGLPNKPHNFQTTRNLLENFVRPDEDVAKFVSVFHPFCRDGLFIGKISRYIRMWDDTPKLDEGQLSSVIDCGREWLLHFASYHVESIPANYRASLMVFDGQELGEISANTTYSFRFDVSKLLPELEKMLRFFWRFPGAPSLLLRREDVSDSSIMDFLYDLLVEEASNASVHPLIVDYCLSRFFRLRNSSDLVQSEENLQMATCDVNGSMVASVMSLLRAGCCSKLYYDSNMDINAPYLTKTARHSRATNILCPLICRMKALAAEKPPRRSQIVTPEGDIVIDQHTFLREKWSRLVPLTREHCIKRFCSLLNGDTWMLLLDKESKVEATSSEGKVTFTVIAKDGTILQNSDIGLVHDTSNMDFDVLSSYMEMALHGFGLGSLRYMEIERMEPQHGNFINNTLYYYSLPKKKKRQSWHRRQMIQHKLPQSIARLFLLYVHLANKMGLDVSSRLIPVRENRKAEMGDAVQELFLLSECPNATLVRQLWASVHNIVFSDADGDGVLSVSREIAESFAHSQRTHRERYNTKLLQGQELRYGKYHHSIGESCCYETDSIRSACLLAEDVKRGLAARFGESASYRSSEQRRMVEMCALPCDKPLHAALPCGGGKSLSWEIPSIAYALRGEIALHIVIVPYKFLALHHRTKYQGLTGQSVRSTMLTASDISQEIPDVLRSDVLLPHTLFVTLEAIDGLMEQHSKRLEDLAKTRILKRIIVDEVHTVFCESFRPVYSCLRKLGQYGVPVVTLSATLPLSFVASLFHYMGLTPNAECETDMEAISGKTLFGTFPLGFQIKCRRVNSLVSHTVKLACNFIARNQGSAIHVLCSTKKIAMDIDKALLTKGIKSGIVTSDCDFETQKRIASQWESGELQALTSTTIALVGNECSSCHALFLVGYPYSTVNFVQALGRLRPAQRKEFGRVEILVESVETIKKTQSMESSIAFEQLVGRGLVTEALRKDYMSLFTPEGVANWLENRSMCWLQAISSSFGYEVDICGCCGVCGGSNIQASTLQVKDNIRQAQKNGVSTLDVLRRLQERCLVCNDTNCRGNGEECLGKSCFNCGGKHWRSNCPLGQTVRREGRSNITKLALILGDRACYRCMDFKKRKGFNLEEHTGADCPMKSRLKRLLIWGAERDGMAFEKFLSRTYSEKIVFETFLSTCGQRKIKKTIATSSQASSPMRMKITQLRPASESTSKKLPRLSDLSQTSTSNTLSNSHQATSSTRTNITQIPHASVNPRKRPPIMSDLSQRSTARKKTKLKVSMNRKGSNCLAFKNDENVSVLQVDFCDLPQLWPNNIHRGQAKQAFLQAKHYLTEMRKVKQPTGRQIYERMREADSTNRVHCHRMASYTYYTDFVHDQYRLIQGPRKGQVYSRTQVNVNLGNNQQTSILIDRITRTRLLQTLQEFGKSIQSCEFKDCRKESCHRQGKICPFGVYNKEGCLLFANTKKRGVRQQIEKIKNVVLQYCYTSVPEFLNDLQRAEKKFPTDGAKFPELGGVNGLGSAMYFSTDLINASHFDDDNSYTMIIFAELKPGTAKGWYFVFEDLCHKGETGKTKRGLVVELFHGCVVILHAKHVRHASFVQDVGEGNHVFGAAFASTHK